MALQEGFFVNKSRGRTSFLSENSKWNFLWQI